MKPKTSVSSCQNQLSWWAINSRTTNTAMMVGPERRAFMDRSQAGGGGRGSGSEQSTALERSAGRCGPPRGGKGLRGLGQGVPAGEVDAAVRTTKLRTQRDPITANDHLVLFLAFDESLLWLTGNLG